MLREVTPSEGVSVVDPRYVRLGSVSPERADTFGQLTEVEKHWVHEPCSLRGLWQLSPYGKFREAGGAEVLIPSPTSSAEGKSSGQQTGEA